MEIGKLRHRLILKHKAEARSAAGGVTYTPTAYVTVSGSVRSLTGREIINAAQTEAQIDHMIVIRRRSDVKLNDQVEHLTRTFEVLAVKDVDERHKVTQLMCREILT